MASGKETEELGFGQDLDGCWEISPSKSLEIAQVRVRCIERCVECSYARGSAAGLACHARRWRV
jgi:hypothetical protein